MRLWSKCNDACSMLFTFFFLPDRMPVCNCRDLFICSSDIRKILKQGRFQNTLH